MLVSGAREDMTGEVAVTVFRETIGAEQIPGGWLLEFGSRRSAESALRAHGVLLRSFGPQARARIVATAMPSQSTNNGNDNNDNTLANSDKEPPSAPMSDAPTTSSGGADGIVEKAVEGLSAAQTMVE